MNKLPFEVMTVASALLFGPLERQGEGIESIEVARAFQGMTGRARQRAFDFLVNGELSMDHLQPRFAALEIADWLDTEAETQEDCPAYTVEESMTRLLGITGEALKAYRHAAEVLRALPPLPLGTKEGAGNG